MSESRQPAVGDWLRQWTPDQRRQVEQLAELVRDAGSTQMEQAIKWKRLTFTLHQDWHHWLCGVAVTREGVQLVFHKGSLLADPARLLRGSLSLRARASSPGRGAPPRGGEGPGGRSHRAPAGHAADQRVRHRQCPRLTRRPGVL